VKAWKREHRLEKRWITVTVVLALSAGAAVLLAHFLFVPLRFPYLGAAVLGGATAIDSLLLLTLRNGYVLKLNPREKLRRKNGELTFALYFSHGGAVISSFLDGRITSEGQVIKVCCRGESEKFHTVLLDPSAAVDPTDLPRANRYVLMGPTWAVSEDLLRTFRWRMAAALSREPEICFAESLDQLPSVLGLDNLRHSYLTETVSRHLTAATFVALASAIAVLAVFLLLWLAGSV
jgi:hypothetical protein